MSLKLTVYTNEDLTKVERVVEADRLKIPYRVTGYLMQSMENLSLDDKEGLFNFITGNTELLDKIIKATFGVSELELDRIDTMELVDVAMDIYAWGVDKIKNLKQGNNSKNVVTTV
jgi:hypothetical protein